MAVDTTIGESDRLRYYEMLAEMDEKSGLLEVNANQIIQSIEEIGIEIPLKDRSSVMKYIKSSAGIANGIYGACYLPQEWPVINAGLEMTKAP